LRAFEIAKKKKANTLKSYKMWEHAGIDAGRMMPNRSGGESGGTLGHCLR
jgi:hypothetical protein